VQDNLPIHQVLDDFGAAIHLHVPGSKTVLLQAFFEHAEGLGAVRTVDVRNSRIMILCSRDSLKACGEMLESIKHLIDWKYIECSDEFEIS